jgi:hypothetical protein
VQYVFETVFRSAGKIVGFFISALKIIFTLTAVLVVVIIPNLLIAPLAAAGRSVTLILWRRPKAAPAYIPPDLRQKFEEIGENVLSHALASGVHSAPHKELGDLLDDHYRAQVWQWLREKRNRQKRKDWFYRGIGWGLPSIVIFIALYNLYITKQADRPELISADARLYIAQQALPHELFTIGWVNMGKRAALRGTATLYTVSKDGGHFYKFGYSEITNGSNSSVTTIPPGLGSMPYAQFPVDMQKFLGLFLVCTKYRDDNDGPYKQKFTFELGAHLAETITRLNEAASSKIPNKTCKR